MKFLKFAFIIIFYFILTSVESYANKCSLIDLQLIENEYLEIGNLAKCFPKCHKRNLPNPQKTNDPNKHKSTNALRRHNEEVVSLVKNFQLSKEQQRRLHDEITGKHLTRAEVETIIKDLFNLN